MGFILTTARVGYKLKLRGRSVLRGMPSQHECAHHKEEMKFCTSLEAQSKPLVLYIHLWIVSSFLLYYVVFFFRSIMILSSKGKKGMFLFWQWITKPTSLSLPVKIDAYPETNRKASRWPGRLCEALDELPNSGHSSKSCSNICL